jgi:hypothetical protein
MQMGAHFYFDKQLAAVGAEVKDKQHETRQVELFAWADALHLRVGKIGEEDQANGPSVVLSKEDALELRDALDAGIRRFGYDK